MQHRRSIRLKDYDYSQAGAYYFTLVTQYRACLFGDIVNDEMKLSDAGEIVWAQWNALSERFPGIELDEFIVMPNHVHGVVVITDAAMVVGAIHELPLQPSPPNEWRIQRRKMLLPKILGYFKMNASKQINLRRDTPGNKLWQRNYYEHIIRNAQELDAIRSYIFNNPAQWAADSEYRIVN